MLILKLNLPEASINYNASGHRTSDPVPFTPDVIRNLQLMLTVTGYTAPDGFFATGCVCDNKALTLHEQFSLLSLLGFKTVPVKLGPDVPRVVDACIRERTPFIPYQPMWWDTAKNEEFKLPFLATVKSILWCLDEKRRLAMRLTTDKGVYDVIDHRIPEYYQVGLQVKIFNGQVQPYMSSAILDNVPTNCPVCNNPLKKFQFANDLPLIIKCVHPMCKIMKTTDEPVLTDAEFEELEKAEEEVVDTSIQEPTPEPVPESVPEANAEILTEEEFNAPPVDQTKIFAVVDLDGLVAAKNYPGLVVVESVQQFETGDFSSLAEVLGIVTKSRRSITKAARRLSESTNLPLIPVNEIEGIIQEKRRND